MKAVAAAVFAATSVVFSFVPASLFAAEAHFVPLHQWKAMPLPGAGAAWVSDRAIADAVANDGVVMIFGRAAGRTKLVVEGLGGVSELEVVVAGGEERSSDRTRTAMIELSTGPRPVEYSVIDGLAMFEGDIVLGTAEELEQPAPRGPRSEPVAQGAAVTGSRFRWPNGIIPFTIDPTLPDRARVAEAVSHWETNTNYRFVPRTTERDYVTFRGGSGCTSWVGRRGGQQFVTLGMECTKGNISHEIGHVVGLWHEQGREDRDRFVRIDFAKVRPDSLHNFNQRISDGDDLGPYDYASIMHYPRGAFSIDGSDTVVPLDPKAGIGQRERLSAGDIAAANSLCEPPAQPNGKRRSAGGR